MLRPCGGETPPVALEACAAELEAALRQKRGRGWHSLRRKFASDLMDQPLKVLCELGGWKSAQTVLQCYQQADQEQLGTAAEHRRTARSWSNWRESIGGTPTPFP